MEKEKNIILMKYYMMENILMAKNMEKGKNIIKMKN